jgi:hypothetical protein
MNHIPKQLCTLAISLSSRGFGYAVMEGDNSLICNANKGFKKERNTRSLAQIDKIRALYKPDVLVLQDVNAKGTRRAPRIKELHRKVMALAKKRGLKVVKISQKKLRLALLGREDGTKQEMAELMASRFPDELASHLPPKRKPWTSEDSRMDIFDAVELGVGINL